MTIVKDYLKWPDNTPMAGVVVEISTLAPHDNEEVFVSIDEATIIGKVKIRTQGIDDDNPGRWEADLTPTSQLIPLGAVYQAVIKVKGSVIYDPIFMVPDGVGPYWVGDILV